MVEAAKKLAISETFDRRRISLGALNGWWLITEKEIHIQRLREKRAIGHWSRYGVCQDPGRVTDT